MNYPTSEKPLRTAIKVLLIAQGLLQSAQYPTIFPDVASINCISYQKLNGTITKWRESDCPVGINCCFSAIVLGQNDESAVETGGCEYDLVAFMYQNPAIEVHPIDRLLWAYDTDKISKLCELQTCIANTSPKFYWRICTCQEENCNENGIDELMKRNVDREEPEVSTRSTDELEEEFLLVFDG